VDGFEVDYTLDDLDRVIAMTRTQGTDTKEVRYAYSKAGDLVGVRYPNGAQVHYEHDSLGRVTYLENTGPLGGVLSSFRYSYDDASRRTKIEREDGTYTTYGYNRAGWLIRETRMDSMGTEPEGDDELIWQDEYSYDVAGNRTQKAHTERLGNGDLELNIRRYKYNQANQLILEWKEEGTVTTATVAGEVWDEESGLAKLTLNGVTPSMWGDYFYGEAVPNNGRVFVLAEDHVKNQTLIGVNVSTGLSDFVGYSYDENGNLVERLSEEGPTVYQWDHRNRLTKVIHPDGQETSYEYCPACPLGKLAKMTRSDSSTVEWVWDGISFLREEDSQDALPMEYFAGLAVKREGAWYYLHTDVMGTVWQMTDENGAIVNDFQWDAWGNELSGTFGDGSAVCQMGWQGKRWDKEQGLFYSVARWYDQRLGRFTQVDPAEGAGIVTTGAQGYGWPGIQPVSARDDSGLSDQYPIPVPVPTPGPNPQSPPATPMSPGYAPASKDQRPLPMPTPSPLASPGHYYYDWPDHDSPEWECCVSDCLFNREGAWISSKLDKASLALTGLSVYSAGLASGLMSTGIGSLASLGTLEWSAALGCASYATGKAGAESERIYCEIKCDLDLVNVYWIPNL